MYHTITEQPHIVPAEQSAAEATKGQNDNDNDNSKSNNRTD